MQLLIRFALLPLVLVCSQAAYGHFVWIDVSQTDGGMRRVHLWFSEEPAAGSAPLVRKIAHATVWACANGHVGRPLALELRGTGETGELISTLPAENAQQVEAIVTYGLFSRGEKPFLLNYYAKRICQSCGAPWQTATSGNLPLDIVPKDTPKGLILEVRWLGNPAAGLEVVVTDPQGKTHQLKTDDAGQVTLADTQTGRYSVRTHVVEENRPGTFGDKPYDQVRHYSTLVFEVAADTATNQLTATELLNQARASRAVWDGFAGFESDLEVHIDNQAARGRVRVSADGAVDVEGFDSLDMKFARQQLDSLVMHRMPGVQVGDEATFESESRSHALGRPVRLVDERMGSVYRVDDDVITEVNRNMGPLRFTISVLDVARNVEGKYLPHVFTVSVWDTKIGTLKTSHTYYHRWHRVGTFDLPQQLMIVTSEQNRRSVMRLRFTNHQLTPTDGILGQRNDVEHAPANLLVPGLGK